MEDTAIVELYWARDQRAITASDEKYGGLCRSSYLHMNCFYHTIFFIKNQHSDKIRFP